MKSQQHQQQQEQKGQPQHQNQKRETIDPGKLIEWLNKTGLINHPIIKSRAEFAMRTGNVSYLMDFIKSNPGLVQEAKQKQEMEELIAASDPFYPRPGIEDFRPGVPCAHINDPVTGVPKAIFMLTPDDLVRHLGIFGSSGGGKTNAVLVLCSQIRKILGDRARIWIFEPKDMYRNFLFPDFDVLEFRDFRDETFEPPTPKIPLHKWFDQTTQFLSTEQYFQTGGKNILNMTLYQTLKWDRHPFPTHELVLKLINRDMMSKAKSFKEKDSYATLKLRMSSIVNFDRYSRNVRIPISDLMQKNVIFEWSDETMEMLSHRTSLLLNKLYMYKKHERSDLINIVIFEEARRHLAPRSGQFGESVLETIATLAREMKIGLVFVSHEPSSIAKVFKANVATTIAFPLSEGEEELAIKRTMNLNPAQFEFYTRMSSLGEGHALVNYRGVNRPFPVYFPFLGNPEAQADPGEVMRAKEEFLSKYVIPENMEMFDNIPEDDENTESKPKPKKPEPVEDPMELSADAKTILDTLHANPFLTTRELETESEFKGTKFFNLRDEIVDKGYAKRIDDIKIKKKGKPLFLDLTDIAYQRFGWKKPSWGNTSLAHRLYQKMVADKLKSQGWDVEIEELTTVKDSGHRFDVLARKADIYSDYEITLSLNNVSDNVKNGFADDRISQVVLVAKDDDVEVCQELLKPEFEVFKRDLEVIPISNFFKK